MAFYYFDASALVKYYILEPGSTWVRKLINATDAQGKRPAHMIFIADLSVAEVAAAFAVLHRTGRIRRPVWDGAFDQFMDDVNWRYQLVRASRDEFFEAALLTRRHPLKAYDAVQLAVALRQSQVLAAYNFPLTFVSGDEALLTTAQAVGLPTDNPFDHVSPHDTPQQRPRTNNK
jgi:predicted nucleic acid-binding protein